MNVLDLPTEAGFHQCGRGENGSGGGSKVGAKKASGGAEKPKKDTSKAVAAAAKANRAAKIKRDKALKEDGLDKLFN